jgi:preprotein translocase subunit SecD
LLSLKLLDATLTLPGIAGIILSVGMAVDANVLIFERFKEEFRAGRTLRAAMDAGFDRAYVAIVDANLTTLLVAVVLFFLGTGPIKGFAVTLGLGIIISMFTAIFVTRYLLKLLIHSNIIKSGKLFGA